MRKNHSPLHLLLFHLFSLTYVLSALNCDLGASDLIFAVKATHLLSADDFLNMKLFMETFVDSLDIGRDPSSTQVGVVLFDNIGEPDYRIKLSAYGRKSDLRMAIDHLTKLPCGHSWCTEKNTSNVDAVNFTNDLFTDAKRMKKIVLIRSGKESTVDYHHYRSLANKDPWLKILEIAMSDGKIVTSDNRYYDYYLSFNDPYKRYASRMAQLYPNYTVPVPAQPAPPKIGNRMTEGRIVFSDSNDMIKETGLICDQIFSCPPCTPGVSPDLGVEKALPGIQEANDLRNNLEDVGTRHSVLENSSERNMSMTLNDADYEYEVVADPPKRLVSPSAHDSTEAQLDDIFASTPTEEYIYEDDSALDSSSVPNSSNPKRRAKRSQRSQRRQSECTCTPASPVSQSLVQVPASQSPVQVPVSPQYAAPYASSNYPSYHPYLRGPCSRDRCAWRTPCRVGTPCYRSGCQGGSCGMRYGSSQYYTGQKPYQPIPSYTNVLQPHVNPGQYQTLPQTLFNPDQYRTESQPHPVGFGPHPVGLGQHQNLPKTPVYPGQYQTVPQIPFNSGQYWTVPQPQPGSPGQYQTVPQPQPGSPGQYSTPESTSSVNDGMTETITKPSQPDELTEKEENPYRFRRMRQPILTRIRSSQPTMLNIFQPPPPSIENLLKKFKSTQTIIPTLHSATGTDEIKTHPKMDDKFSEISKLTDSHPITVKLPDAGSSLTSFFTERGETRKKRSVPCSIDHSKMFALHQSFWHPHSMFHAMHAVRTYASPTFTVNKDVKCVVRGLDVVAHIDNAGMSQPTFERVRANLRQLYSRFENDVQTCNALSRLGVTKLSPASGRVSVVRALFAIESSEKRYTHINEMTYSDSNLSAKNHETSLANAIVMATNILTMDTSSDRQRALVIYLSQPTENGDVLTQAQTFAAKNHVLIVYVVDTQVATHTNNVQPIVSLDFLASTLCELAPSKEELIGNKPFCPWLPLPFTRMGTALRNEMGR